MEFAAAEVKFALEDGNPWLAIWMLLDELYGGLGDTYAVLVTLAVTVM